MRYGLNYDQRHQLSVLLDKSYEDYHNYSDLINIDPLELSKPVENYSPLNPCEGLKQMIHKNISQNESRESNSTKAQLST